jgi:hypothetical protein
MAVKILNFPKKKKCGDCKKFDRCYADSCVILNKYDMDDYEEAKKANACPDINT